MNNSKIIPFVSMTQSRQLFYRKTSLLIPHGFALGLWYFSLTKPIVQLLLGRTGFLLASESCIIATLL